jgi:lysophospholipase L1-like esterase
VLQPAWVAAPPPLPGAAAYAAIPGGPRNWPTALSRPLLVLRHQEFVRRAQAGDLDLVFFGDSSTDFWRYEGRGKAVWDSAYARLRSANFGIEGSTAPEVLWRMQNGELDGYRAKVIVLSLLGVSDLSQGATTEAVVRGNAAILAEIRKRQPQAKIILVDLFPRNRSAQVRAEMRPVNARLAALADSSSVHYLALGEAFVTADPPMAGLPNADPRYPRGYAPKGYAVWAEAMSPLLKTLMP